MIFEQSFFNLPEILVGARFLEQAYETGITGAFAMAVLQELNGRNVNNPLAHIQLEHSYQVPDGSAKRSIRADMFLRTQNIGVSNKNLDSYGWRHSNFLEAKFIRDSSRVFPKPVRRLGYQSVEVTFARPRKSAVRTF